MPLRAEITLYDVDEDGEFSEIASAYCQGMTTPAAVCRTAAENLYAGLSLIGAGKQVPYPAFKLASHLEAHGG